MHLFILTPGKIPSELSVTLRQKSYVAYKLINVGNVYIDLRSHHYLSGILSFLKTRKIVDKFPATEKTPTYMFPLESDFKVHRTGLIHLKDKSQYL